MRVRMKRKPAMRDQPIHDGNAHSQAELLTANPVDQRFEEGREARGLEAQKPLRQPVQPRVARGERIELPEICLKAKQSLESRTHLRLMDIIDPTDTTVDALMKLDLPAGVDVEIKVQ